MNESTGDAFQISNQIQVQNPNMSKVADTGGKSYECQVCHKTFGKTNCLRMHAKTHSGEKKYKCQVCEKTFSRNDSLIVHTRSHTGEKPYECIVCRKAYARPDQLDVHQRTHTGEKPFECPVCCKTFSSAQKMKLHAKLHTGQKPYKCQLCDKVFACASYLCRHRAVHTGEKRHKCQLCERAFHALCNLRDHMRTHTGERPFRCEICDKTFITAGILNEHKRIHSGERLHKCLLCDKAFFQVSNLNFHMRTHAADRPYKCEICSKAFLRKDYMDMHMTTHTGQKRYKCPLCHRGFSWQSAMNKHLVLNHKEKPKPHRRPFIQNINTCKSFVPNIDKQFHSGMQTGGKLYKCKVCHKIFFTSADLRVDMRDHIGRNKGKSGHTNFRNLNTQLRTCATEKPFKCPSCHKTFAQKSSLNRHAAVHVRKIYPLDPDTTSNANRSWTDKLKTTFSEHELQTDKLLLHWVDAVERPTGSVKGQLKILHNIIIPSVADINDDKSEQLPREHVQGTESVNRQKQSLAEGEFSRSVNAYERSITAQSYGCGICDKMFQFGKQFSAHCSHHSLAEVTFDWLLE